MQTLLLAGAGAAGEQTAGHGGGEFGDTDQQQLNPPASCKALAPRRPGTASGILTTWYKRVHTCLRHVCTRYVQCLSTAAYIHAMYKYEKS